MQLSGMPTTATVLRAWARGIAPEEVISTRDWVSRNIYVPDGPRAGQLFDASLAPYIPGIYDALDDETVNEVWVRKSAQVGFTLAGIGWVGACIDSAPAHDMIIQPTLAAATDFNRKKLQPAIEASPALRKKVRRPMARSSEGSTALTKAFPGGSLTLTGANSAADLRSKTTRRQFRDEVDEWPLDLDGQGDPMGMADARQIAFHATGDWKRLIGSTPTIKGASRVDSGFEAGDQRYWQVPCPQCGEFQVLEFGGVETPHGLKFNKVWPHKAHYICVNGCVIEHHQKPTMVRAGKWVARQPGPGRVPSFHIDALVSLLTTWDSLAKAFLDAKDDPQQLKAFVNLWLGQSFEERGEAPDWQHLMLRREEYDPRTIPPGGLLITGSADVQMNGIYYEVVAWGIDKQSWSIDIGFLQGDTADVSRPVWKAFEAILDRTYPDAFGGQWPADLFGVDSGFNTNTVYEFCRRHPRARATKGDDGWHKPAIASSPTAQQVTYKGKRRGVKLWHIGTWPLKAEFYQNLRKEGVRDGEEAFPPGYCHFTSSLHDEAYFRQATAEHLKQEERNGRIVHRWVESAANHYLDCRIGARAMAELLGISRLTANDWANISAARGPRPVAQSDMWDPSNSLTAPMASKPNPTVNRRPRIRKMRIN